MNLTGFIWTNWRRSLLAWSPTHRLAILSFLGNIQITASNIMCFKFSWRLFQLETFFARYRIVFTIAISMWVLKELYAELGDNRGIQPRSSSLFVKTVMHQYSAIVMDTALDSRSFSPGGTRKRWLVTLTNAQERMYSILWRLVFWNKNFQESLPTAC